MDNEFNRDFNLAIALLTPKEKEYYDYIVNHIHNVHGVWEELQKMKPDFLNDDFNWSSIDELLRKHDLSKLDTTEFAGYAQWFFPTNDGPKNKSWFQRAWLCHMHKNPHHWQYWVVYGTPQSVALKMPFSYLIEMLCDWTAMSLKFKNAPSIWFAGQEVLIHEDSLQEIMKYLPTFDKIYEKLVKE